MIPDKKTGGDAELERLGRLAHDLRNALSAAMTAHYMARRGGPLRRSHAILERSLARMKDSIDRALAEAEARAVSAARGRSRARV